MGTSAPIFGTSVEIRFYNELHLPIAIIIGLLNGFSLILKWKSSNTADILKNLRVPVILTIVLTLGIVILGSVYGPMQIILTFSAAFALIVNAEIALKVIKRKKYFLGAYVAHTGIALFILGVVATGGFTKEKQIDLTKNETTELFGYELTFLGYNPIENVKKIRIQYRS